MATSKAVARSLELSAQRISGVRREIVAEVSQFAIEEAVSVGGTFFGGRYSLFAEVVEKRDNKTSSTVLVYPKPAGFWSIKSYGRSALPARDAVYGRPDGFIARGPIRDTSGDGRWDRVKQAVDERFDELSESLVDEALEG